MTPSKHFGRLSLLGLKKAGDLLIPGTDELPAFSSLPLLTEIDRIANYMNADDRSGFAFLTVLFGLMPQSLIHKILTLAENADKMPSWIAPALRQINIGVKGVIYTLYYTDITPDRRIRKMLNWNTQCGPETRPSFQTNLSDAEKAFTLARSAEKTLKKMSVTERLTYITRLKNVILKNQDTIMDQIQKETGKSRTDAIMSEIFPILDHLSYLEKFASKVLKDRSAHTPLALLGKKSEIYFEPMGTTLVISPWNYPFYQAIVPITLSFVCGNATVFKPSEITPLKGLVEKTLEEAGFQPEWAPIVYGDGKLGKELIDQRPNKIFFTGSTSTGKKIMAQASNYLIPVELELGGKDPMIVFEDVNLHRTTSAALWGGMTNSGQSCTSVERVYVQTKIYESFKKMLVEKAEKIRVGVDTDGNADMGKMTSAVQVTVVADHIEDALAKGAILLTGQSWDRRSMTIPPLILENVTPQMKVYYEETFGPILPLIPFETEEDAIQMANDSEFGLSASVFSKDRDRAIRVARSIKTGNVSINNVMLTEGNHALPFGGTKNSGFGRYKGEFGFYSFTNIKSILIDGMSGKIEANWYPFSPEKLSLFRDMMSGLFGKGPKSLAKFGVNGIKLESLSGKAAKL